MNEDTLCLFHSIFDEVKYLTSDRVSLLVIVVEENLILLVEPVELQVGDPNRLPVIGYLPPGAIDYMSNLVGHHEFKVLCGELIADKQPVLDLNGTDHIIGECTHHHLLLHHLLLLLVKHGLHMRLILLMAPSSRARGTVVGLLLLLLCSHFVFFSIR